MEEGSISRWREAVGVAVSALVPAVFSSAALAWSYDLLDCVELERIVHRLRSLEGWPTIPLLVWLMSDSLGKVVVSFDMLLCVLALMGPSSCSCAFVAVSQTAVSCWLESAAAAGFIREICGFACAPRQRNRTGSNGTILPVA